ncbi:hypothetical protein LOK49_LG11G01618 [Camellia lanceoleosa]|uniref:Uncharacterized protein n=1 Tax=Camellia lanceoleosa TaxID=1840588 RepID=A0ACC0FXJ3_9ERIC|nr:hypothetical protein LOK49_LG11G01618 [Camellia lanceoleosa]
MIVVVVKVPSFFGCITFLLQRERKRIERERERECVSEELPSDSSDREIRVFRGSHHQSILIFLHSELHRGPSQDLHRSSQTSPFLLDGLRESHTGHRDFSLLFAGLCDVSLFAGLRESHTGHGDFSLLFAGLRTMSLSLFASGSQLSLFDLLFSD